MLFGIVKRSGAELSAHQMIEAEHEQWSSIAQLAAEYETIAADAQHNRWVRLIREVGLDESDVERLLDSGSFAPLTAEFRRAEANGYNLEKVLPQLVASRGLADAHDVGAVLISRLHHATDRPKRVGRRRTDPQLIVGLIPVAIGPMTTEQRQSLDERRELMEARATSLTEHAVEGRDPWITAMGSPAQGAVASRAWRDASRVVAAYRDRYDITGPHPLGRVPEAITQRADRARAAAALRRARESAREAAGRRAPEIRSTAIAR